MAASRVKRGQLFKELQILTLLREKEGVPHLQGVYINSSSGNISMVIIRTGRASYSGGGETSLRFKAILEQGFIAWLSPRKISIDSLISLRNIRSSFLRSTPTLR